MSEQSQTQKKALRKKLMLGGGLLILVIGLVFYGFSGRYISTDNAYVKGAKIMITPQVSGVIETVNVTDNQTVKAGELLFAIDPTIYKIAVAKAEADLASTITHINELKAAIKQEDEAVSKAESDAQYASKEYQRRYKIRKSGSVSASELDKFKNAAQTAEDTVDMLSEERNRTLAQLNGNPDIAPEDHPDVKAAQAALEKAQYDLEHTKVLAPVEGIISEAPREGSYANNGVPAFAMLGTQEMWIDANYKETEITNMHIGQTVSIEIDSYPDQEWEGTIESIAPVTGAEFSVLPAQNATGNWVKIVQRIPVRVAIHAKDGQPPLRGGMSTHVTVDTEHFPHLPFSGSGDKTKANTKLASKG